jgi:hypothetical protein
MSSQYARVLKSLVTLRQFLVITYFWLHKFRATFSTWSLWASVDLQTVRLRLGPSDIESTMR